MVSGSRSASVPLKSAIVSAATTPAPPPFVTMAIRLPGMEPDARENLASIEHLIQIDNAQYPGAAQRGGVDVIGTCERSRMRKSQPWPLPGAGRP